MSIVMDSPLAAQRPKASAPRWRRVAGVTLLELMAVVMIIGVLGVIAIPSYRQYSMRAQRTDAKNALLRLQTNQERFYLQNRRYGLTADLPALGFITPRTEKGGYELSITSANTQQTYTATATVAAGGQINQLLDAECQSLSITAQGLRTATPDPQTRCW